MTENDPTAREIRVAWHQAMVNMMGSERAAAEMTVEAMIRAGYTPPAIRHMIDSSAMTVQMRLPSQKRGSPKPQE